jgi:hypothetical protein
MASPEPDSRTLDLVIHNSDLRELEVVETLKARRIRIVWSRNAPPHLIRQMVCNIG